MSALTVARCPPDAARGSTRQRRSDSLALSAGAARRPAATGALATGGRATSSRPSASTPVAVPVSAPAGQQHPHLAADRGAARQVGLAQPAGHRRRRRPAASGRTSRRSARSRARSSGSRSVAAAPASGSEVAQPGRVTGSSSARSVTLSPMPTTSRRGRRRRHRLGEDAGALAPPPTSRSLGHLRAASSSASRVTASASATPASSGSQPYPAGARPASPVRHGHAGRSRTLTARPARGGDCHCRPSRPRPAVCRSATTTRPSGSPARAAAGHVGVGRAGLRHAAPGGPRARPGATSARRSRPRVQRRAVQVGVRRAGHPVSLRRSRRRQVRQLHSDRPGATVYDCGVVTIHP